MQSLNIHEAKTHLSRLIQKAIEGEPFVIAKAGKPLVKVTALDPDGVPSLQRIGFLKGEFTVPDDFDGIGQGVIEDMFAGDAD